MTFHHLRRAGAAAALLAALAVPAPAAAPALEKVRLPDGRQILALPGQVIVRYRAGSAEAGASRLQALGATPRKRIGRPGMDMQVISVPAGQSVDTFLNQLRSDPNVEFAEPNGVMRALAFPQDPPNDSGGQFYLDSYTTPSPAHINIDDAWQITTGIPSVVVAVVDTGVAQAHADLAGQLVPGRKIRIDWLNDGDCTDTPLNTPELNGVGPDQCEDGNPEDDNDIDPNTGGLEVPPTFHGTHVAGIIGALTDNGTNISGIAPGCKIMGVKALNSWGFGSFSSIADGIIWAADNGASIINLSLGGEGSDTSGSIQTAVAHALTKDCVLVAAAGNSGNFTAVNFPANFTGVIAVGSIDAANGLSNFSATGKNLDLVAPGESILSLTKPRAQNGFVTEDTENGTSFSAPMVAGVAALIRSVDPTLSWVDVTSYLDFTATDLGAQGFDNSFGFGRVNAGAAVAAARNREVFVAGRADPSTGYPRPNPFRPNVHREVHFSLPSSIVTTNAGGDVDGDVEIVILNVAGEEVKTLSGTVVWDGRSEGGDLVASGLYFFRAKTSKGDAKGKITVIK